MEARSKGKNFLIPAVKASMKKIGCFSIILLKATTSAPGRATAKTIEINPKTASGVAFPERYSSISSGAIFSNGTIK